MQLTPPMADAAPTAAPRSRALTPGQLVGAGVSGLVLWFAAAMTVQFGAPLGLFAPTGSLVLFITAAPTAWLFVILIRKIVRLQRGQVVTGIGVGLVAATFADGIALTWFHGLYGSDPAHVIAGAGWILWGVGAFLLAAFWEDQR